MKEDNKNIQQELENIAPFLASLPKKEKVPMPNQIYFEGLQQRVANRLAIEAPIKPNSPSSMDVWIEKIMILLQPKFSVAYLTVIGLMIISQIFKTENIDKPIVIVSNTAIQEYLTETELSEEIIADNINNSDIISLEKQLATNNDLPKESINNFILENNIETYLTEEDLL